MLSPDQSSKHSIILEGPWGVGKSSVANKLVGSGSYTLVPEPLHDSAQNNPAEEEITPWYLKQHRERLERLVESKDSLILERSELSTFAYRYANTGYIPPSHEFEHLSAILESKKTLLVYLSSRGLTIQANEAIHDQRVRQIISDRGKFERYQEWYERILPFKFGIVPFLINAIENGERRSADDIVSDIFQCLKNNRIAQANAILFRRDDTSLKVLMLRRAPKRGGFWQAVTGGIHIGESLFNAGEREIFEETGVSAGVIPTNFVHSFKGEEGYTLHEYVLTTLVDAKAQISITNEHVTYEWLTILDAIERAKFPGNKRAIEIAGEIIEKVA